MALTRVVVISIMSGFLQGWINHLRGAPAPRNVLPDLAIDKDVQPVDSSTTRTPSIVMMTSYNPPSFYYHGRVPCDSVIATGKSSGCALVVRARHGRRGPQGRSPLFAAYIALL